MGVEEVLHGTVVADPYRWLEDGTSPDVAAWVGLQDALARRHLDALDGREALSERLSQLFYLDAVSPPHRAGDRLFYRGTTQTRRRRSCTGATQMGAKTMSSSIPTPLGRWHRITRRLGALVRRQDPRLRSPRETTQTKPTLHLMDVATRTSQQRRPIEGAR